MKESYLPLRVAARRLKLPSEDFLLEACRNGRLEAREFGGEWYVREAALASFSDFDRAAAVLTLRHRLLRPLVYLLLAVSLIMVVDSFWFGRAWRPLARGGEAVGVSVSRAVAALTVLPPPSLGATSAFAPVGDALTRLWLALLDWRRAAAANLAYGWEKVSGAWNQFLGRAPPEAPSGAAPSVGLDPDLVSRLKEEIKRELAVEFSNNVQPAAGGRPRTGLVLLPSTGDRVKDRALLVELESVFSDQVDVRFEPSGQTGVITPIFRSGRGDDYIFIITPIKKNTP